jgi:hypothetical protein
MLIIGHEKIYKHFTKHRSMLEMYMFLIKTILTCILQSTVCFPLNLHITMFFVFSLSLRHSLDMSSSSTANREKQ